MTTSEFYKKQRDKYRRKDNAELPPEFKAAMRFNALQRGVKWKDTYKLHSNLSQ